MSLSSSSFVRVALVGAGNIAEVHAAALDQIDGVRVAAVVDPSAARAEQLAGRYADARALTDVAQLTGGDVPVDCAHVLTPPPTHADLAVTLLTAGVDVLVEKPMAESDADSARMQAAAAKGGARLSVNQNFVYHPAFAELSRLVDAGRIGTLRRIDCEYSMPLRQLAARQFGHWMFDNPRNLLLEQAVHPLSQIQALMGAHQAMRVLPAAPKAVDDGIELIDDWSVLLTGETCGAHLHVALGARHPVWRLRALGDDGEVWADMLANRTGIDGPTRWIEATDSLLRGVGAGWQQTRQAVRGFVGYSLATAGLLSRRDPFYLSMRESIQAFYTERASEPDRLDGAFGRRLVAACAAVAAEAPRPLTVLGAPEGAADPADTDVVVLGGTGFIGRHLVAALVDAGQRVTVVSRAPNRLAAPFHHPNVRVQAGSMADVQLLARLFANKPRVVNLAHGGGSGREGAAQALVGGATTVARAAQTAGVPHLVHVSSIAALDLGDPAAIVTATTPPDRRYNARADYARAKVLAERALFELVERDGLPLTVVRPGLVVGAGTSPFHSGVGFFNRETHGIGWNRGTNPLPFVLVQDVAAAIAAILDRPACADGRTYNLVGDVRLSARAYLDALSRATGRPIQFHPSSPTAWYIEELGKWAIKRAAGRRVPAPSRHDFRSRGLAATFDTTAEKRDLGWKPEDDTDEFLARAFVDVG